MRRLALLALLLALTGCGKKDAPAGMLGLPPADEDPEVIAPLQGEGLRRLMRDIRISDGKRLVFSPCGRETCSRTSAHARRIQDDREGEDRAVLALGSSRSPTTT